MLWISIIFAGTDINSLEKPKTIIDYTNTLQFPVAFLNFIVISFLSYQVYIYNRNKDITDFKSKTPLIVIRQESYTGIYTIVNSGLGPALNIRILSDLDKQNKIWRKNQIGFDLINDTKIELNQIDKEQYLILYSDMFGYEYFTYMKDNFLIFNSIEKKISNKYKSKHYLKALEKINYERADESFLEHHIPSV